MDLPLLYPAAPDAAARSDLLLSQGDPRVQDRGHRFQAQALRAGHVVLFVQGRRTDAEQFALWRKGRAYVDRAGREIELTQVGGVWRVKDASLVVTRAMTAKESEHGCKCGLGDAHRPNDNRGCARAVDWAFAIDGRLVGPRPGKGNDSWDPDLPWAEVARIGIDCGFISGASFGESRPGALDGWDAGHLQLPPRTNA